MVYWMLLSDDGRYPFFNACDLFSRPDFISLGNNNSSPPEIKNNPEILTKPSHQAPIHLGSFSVRFIPSGYN